MLRLFFSIIFFTFVIKYGTMIPILSKSAPLEASKCLIEILNTYFSTSKKMSVHFCNGSSSFANEILENVGIPTVVNSLERWKDLGIDKRTPTDVILVLDEMTDLHFMLNTTLWYGDSVFLVVSNSVSNLKGIFSIFWDNKIVNMYVLIEDSAGCVTVYSFLPQGPTNCGVGNPHIIDTWRDNQFETGNIAKITDKVKIKNMNGCSVNISVVDCRPYSIFHHNRSNDIDGIEGKIMLEVARVLNFDAWFDEPRDGGAWGYVIPEPVGAVGEVYTRYSDFAMGLLGPSFGRYENIDFSAPYSPLECGTFGVPRGKRGNQDVWIRFLLSEFSEVVWLWIFLSVIATATVYLVSIKFRRYTAVYHILSTIIGVPAKYPTLKGLKILYLLWSYVSLMFTSSYQSSLNSKLTVPTADKDIETFEQLLDSDLELHGFKNYLSYINYTREESNMRRLMDRYVYTNHSIESAIHAMITKRNIAYTNPRSSFIYYSLLDEDSRGEVNDLEDCIHVFYPAIMLKKHSPYTKQLNKVIERLLNGGLINYWRSFYLYDVPEHIDPVVKLTLAKLKGIFFFLIGGLFASVVAFISEVLYHIKKIKS